MNNINFLFGVTIGIMTRLLVSIMPTSHVVKASSCSSSASAEEYCRIHDKPLRDKLLYDNILVTKAAHQGVWLMVDKVLQQIMVKDS